MNLDCQNKQTKQETNFLTFFQNPKAKIIEFKLKSTFGCFNMEKANK